MASVIGVNATGTVGLPLQSLMQSEQQSGQQSGWLLKIAPLDGLKSQAL